MRTIIIGGLIACLLGGAQALAATPFPPVYFEPNRSELSEASAANLHEIAGLLKAMPAARAALTVTSCDLDQESGSLWFERAVAVRTFLLQHGVAPEQVVELTKASSEFQKVARDSRNSNQCSSRERAVWFHHPDGR